MVPLPELVERTPTRIAPEDLPVDVGREIWQRYRKQIAVEFPSPKTDGYWELTPKGFVGYAPVTPDVTLSLRPKVSLSNLFAMLEYAYRLDFLPLEGRVEVGSLAELFDRLAIVLARRVSDRIRKGLYRGYVTRREGLPYLRGRLVTQEAACQPWSVHLPCVFDEHTVDVSDNQILYWALEGISRSSGATARSRVPVARAVRGIRGPVSLRPYRGSDCVGRRYDRLNDDYRPMHAIARFFLDHSGPIRDPGERMIEPFLIDMDRLFEMFVAEWLRMHLPEEWGLTAAAQEKFLIQAEGDIHFRVDLMLRRRRTGEVEAVLDTKYKAVTHPSADDIAQVVAYAEAHGCSEAFLVYPEALGASFDSQIGRVKVRSLVFDVSTDLGSAGDSLLSELARTL